MRFVDVPNPLRVKREPDETAVLLESGGFTERGFMIRRVELRQYIEDSDPKLGPLSLITAVVETDRGGIEVMYDEGYRGTDVLESVKALLVSHIGLSSLILRSVLALKTHLDGKRQNAGQAGPHV